MQKTFQNKTRLKSFLAQSAAELAIFGSIVIFVVSLIFRTGFSASQSVNMELSAFRKALLESYKTSYGYYGAEFQSSRVASVVMVVEDRLDVDPSKKQGTRDRSPLMAQGTAMMTNMLFYEKDPMEVAKVSFFDLYVNGLYFPMTSSGFVTYTYEYDDMCSADQTIKLNGNELRLCSEGVVQPTGLDDYDNVKTPFQAYESDWESGDVGGRMTICQVLDCVEHECTNSSGVPYTVNLPCVKVYNRIANGVDEWCDEDTTECNLRFDLDLDGNVDVPYDKTYEGPTGGELRLRENFSWQWYNLTAVKGGGFKKGEEFDVDGDWDEEEIQKVTFDSEGRATSVTVLDPNEGDVDFSRTRSNIFGESSVGLGKESRMISFTDDESSGENGTSLRLQEGALVGSSSARFTRSETRQEHIDFIERVFYLSGEPTRFCDGANSVRDWTHLDSNPTTANQLRRTLAIPLRVENPVEACSGDCFSGGNQELTCIDTDADPPVLFIRTRLHDQRRKSWLTRMTTGEGNILQ